MSNLKEKYMNPYQKQIENLYLGILNNYSNFLNGKKVNLIYDFKAKELKFKYSLKYIAKSGTSFESAKRSLHYFAPILKHNFFMTIT